MKYITDSADETLKLGEKFGKNLKPGQVVALIGDLGSGKTVFTKGIAKGLGIKDHLHVNSPSFVIIKKYEGSPPLYHFDLYRLDSVRDLDTVGHEEYFYSKGISVIEWADRALEALPDKYITVKFRHSGETRREIKIS